MNFRKKVSLILFLILQFFIIVFLVLKSGLVQNPPEGIVPDLRYELLRRRIDLNVNQLWLFVKGSLEQNMTKESLQLLRDHKNAILSDLAQMQINDGHNDWRRRDLKELGDIVQKRLWDLQHPDNCVRRKKVVCKLPQEYGFGCQVHQIVICLLIAYELDRTMIIDESTRTIYNVNWDEVFEPLSSCSSTSGGLHRNWSDHGVNSDQVQVIHVPVLPLMQKRPSYIIDTAIPSDLADRLIRVHGDPMAWWVAQFVRYILRFQSNTKGELDPGLDKLIKAKEPILGIHIRRTDKVTWGEANKYELEQYMNEVDDIYDRLDLQDPLAPSLRRHVYIATDDDIVIEEARKKYPQYDFLCNERPTKGHRSSRDGLMGIISDLDALSRCDYVVCTFSSNICRLVYEMKLGLDPMTYGRVITLDAEWYLVDNPPVRYRRAVLKHVINNGTDVAPGDMILDASFYDRDRSKGFVAGLDKNTMESVRVPRFKLEEVVYVREYRKAQPIPN